MALLRSHPRSHFGTDVGDNHFYKYFGFSVRMEFDGAYNVWHLLE